MAEKKPETVLQQIRQVVGAPGPEEIADHHLLQRFLRSQEESAFATLVRRHGPMVLGVCRRILRDPHQAEDAFQATFLVLARKAGSIRKQESVASWLHGVALRVAGKARTSACRRSALERRVMAMRQSESPKPRDRSELGEVLDQELRRLPEKYRAPLVLCYLEGKSSEEAARELGWTPGMVRGRLFRGRDLLRDRLARRGLAGIAAGGLEPALAPSAAPAVPAALLEATIRGGLLFAKSQGALAGLSASTVALAEAAMWGLFWEQWKAPLLAVTAGAAGMTGLATAVGLGLLGTEHGPAPGMAQVSPAPAVQDVEEGQNRVEYDLVQGLFGPGRVVPGLVQALERGTGGVIRARVVLSQPDGQPAAGVLAVLRWRGGEEQLHADGNGEIRFTLRPEILEELRLALPPAIAMRCELRGGQGEKLEFLATLGDRESATAGSPWAVMQADGCEVICVPDRLETGRHALQDLAAMQRLCREYAGLALPLPCRLVLLEPGQAAPESGPVFQITVSAADYEAARLAQPLPLAETGPWLVLHRWGMASLCPDALAAPAATTLAVRSALAEGLAWQFCRNLYPQVASQRLRAFHQALQALRSAGIESVDLAREPNAAGGAAAFVLLQRRIRAAEPPAIAAIYTKAVEDPEAVFQDYLVPAEVGTLITDLEKLLQEVQGPQQRSQSQ
jgi:RNA polymerase sigma factor (sigma-70 family)